MKNGREESVNSGGFGFCSFSRLKKTGKAVACFLDRWKRVLGTGLIGKKVEAVKSEVKNGTSTSKRSRFNVLSDSDSDPYELSGMGGQSEVDYGCKWDIGDRQTKSFR